ncbi:unnamed protein product [Rotaria sordida]|uniref:Uncharacterized protein n=1 Tax=Rotaria sordida TaxID=392033 RepID=A0A813S8M2_9BILA|nr:unnamed protein product [Rotaria sordida]CAF0806029.1 unnamed protein product [Rotaria sordida]
MGDVYLERMLSNANMNRAYVSAIFSLLESITLGSAPISTVFTNTFGCRRMTIIGSILGSIGFFLSRWYFSVYYYYLTIGIIGGIGCGLIYLPAIVSVGYYFEEKRSFAMGIAFCGSGLGTVAFPFVMPWLIDKFFLNDYKNGLLFESALILTCVLYGFTMIPLPIEPSEQRRLRLKARSEMTRQIINQKSNINTQNNQTNESMNQYDSLPFLMTSANNVPNEQRRLPEDRRHTTIPFQNTSCIDGNANNQNDRVWESRPYLSSPHRYSLVNRLTLYNSTLIIAGVAAIFAPYSGSHILPHLIYATFFGFFTGGYVGLTSIITVDLVGIDKLSNGMGIILLFQGVATAIGTPAAGAMRDAFEAHARPFLWPYFLFGSLVALSGAILFALPILRRRDQNQQAFYEPPLNTNDLSH